MPRKRRDTPWLDQRENGVFYAHWYDPDKKRTQRCSLDTSDVREAQIAFGQFLLNGRVIYENSDDGISVAKCMDMYITEHVNRKCAAPRRQQVSALHLKAFFGDTLISDVDIPMSRLYREARASHKVSGTTRRGKGVCDATIARELAALSAAAHHAVRWKRLSRDKLPVIEMPSATAKEAQYYTKDELNQLIDAAEGDLKCFIRIAYWTAGRRASIETLHVDQIDFDAKVINLDKPGAQKTNKRRPIVPLYDAIQPDIEWLVERSENGRLFNCAGFYDRFKTLCKHNGMEHKSHPHLLRHTRATHLLQRGVSIYDVAKLLGDTVKTLESTYGHHSSEYLATTTGEM